MVYSIQRLKIVSVLVVENSHTPTPLLFFFWLNTDTITVINCHGIRNINFAVLLIAGQGKRDINYFERIMTLSIFLK